MSFADELKAQLHIVDVIGQYVRLKRQGSGARYLGLCPFHVEKTPSFNVNSALQYYKCFGCDAAGDVFRFVMEHDHLTFPETLKSLAERYGIAMPERQRSDDPEASRRNALLEMHEIAAELFGENLRSASGAEARAYLERRGVPREAIGEFRIGLADASGRQLAARLERFGSALMQESGLVLKRQEGDGFFDRFRGRLMFPIHNESGKVIAFGGRALRAGDEPKYLNSPETPIYRKSTVLFNLHRAKIDARKNGRMVLVEGYMDVIGVYTSGIKEVVASSGTALSFDQVRSIKRQIVHFGQSAGTLILNFDPDQAGQRSTEKHIPAALAEGLRVHVLSIPGGLDPDEFIQQNGPDAYRKLLEHAESYFHWLALRARERFNLQTAEGRVDALKFIGPSVRFVPNGLERSAVVHELADSLKLDRQAVTDFLRQLREPEAAVRKESTLTSAINPNEKILIACLLASHDARITIREYFHHSQVLPALELKGIFDAALNADAGNSLLPADKILEQLDDRSRKIFLELSFSDSGINENDAPFQALHCLEALETMEWRRKRDDLKQHVREAEQSGDFARAIQWAEELKKLQNGPQRAPFDL